MSLYRKRIEFLEESLYQINIYLKENKKLNLDISVFSSNDVIFLVNLKYDSKLIVTYNKNGINELSFVEFLNKFDLTSYDKQKLFSKILNCIQKEKLRNCI